MFCKRNFLISAVWFPLGTSFIGMTGYIISLHIIIFKIMNWFTFKKDWLFFWGLSIYVFKSTEVILSLLISILYHLWSLKLSSYGFCILGTWPHKVNINSFLVLSITRCSRHLLHFLPWSICTFTTEPLPNNGARSAHWYCWFFPIQIQQQDVFL